MKPNQIVQKSASPKVRTNVVKQLDGKTLVIPMDRGLFDVFTDGEGWENNWSRYRRHGDKVYQVAGNRLLPAFVHSLKLR